MEYVCLRRLFRTSWDLARGLVIFKNWAGVGLPLQLANILVDASILYSITAFILHFHYVGSKLSEVINPPSSPCAAPSSLRNESGNNFVLPLHSLNHNVNSTHARRSIHQCKDIFSQPLLLRDTINTCSAPLIGHVGTLHVGACMKSNTKGCVRI